MKSNHHNDRSKISSSIYRRKEINWQKKIYSRNNSDLLLLLSRIDQFFISNLLVRSFNRPRFCPNASWNPNATNVANSSTIGSQPYALFVNTFNTLFVANYQNGRILIWRNGSINPTTTILANLSNPSSLLVNDDQQIFVDNGNTSKRVERWTSNGIQLPSPMSICSVCYGLFVDSNDQLYCSQYSSHQVLRQSLQNPSSPTMIVAGTGCSGSTATQLNNPYGIFVTDQSDLYVADSVNNRIQLFREGEINATTMTINGTNGIIITLWRPSGVMLDQDGYLFIVDSYNHRVIGSDRWGFRCVAACEGLSGSASNQLSSPRTMNFDIDGNLLVMDTDNNRVQKFLLATNSCLCKSKINVRWDVMERVLSCCFPLLDSNSMTSMSMTTTSRTDEFTSKGRETSTSTVERSIKTECKSLFRRRIDKEERELFWSFLF